MVPKLKLKVNDTVQVVSGRDRGKQGKITQVFPQDALVVVEGVNIRVKHLKAGKAGQSGNRVQFSAPLPIAKVALVCPHCGKASRVNLQVGEDGHKNRICKRCQQIVTNSTT